MDENNEKKVKVRTSITIDPDLWARCKAVARAKSPRQSFSTWLISACEAKLAAESDNE